MWVGIFWSILTDCSSSSEKRWVFMFTWMTTRAVHIKIVTSIGSGCCAMWIEKNISRRSTQSVVWSDNGTNFVVAKKEFLLWNRQAPSLLVHKGVSWKSNPYGGPHHGSFWEWLMLSWKRLFYAIIGTRKIMDDRFSTTFCFLAVHWIGNVNI